MSNNIVETVIGAVVIAIAAMFLIFAYRTADIAPGTGYELVAKFDKVNGVTTGADVRLSGIKIGSVKSTELESPTYLALVRLNIASDVKIPADSSIRVLADGLLGDTFLSVEPGGDEANLNAGDSFRFAQGSVNIMDLVGQAIYSGGSSNQ
ncbi:MULTISPECIES: outer membrane lipid asymmetry maintenance protein MlaD [unclassified Minwuia]|jgi:phospholipid/cholesterol/gamma-HCH transport system substrate-binding protein|uniref:outer membrane lipid asymmetry maintenance protein MlaD n=1 Tax=unclassified Minwuia TaxID=2618799 RepID=UPI0024788FBF|nr:MULTISPECIES: outer membrane lipid asymmetry maintenance protein MlaD [unclassified Minwuia]